MSEIIKNEDLKGKPINILYANNSYNDLLNANIDNSSYGSLIISDEPDILFINEKGILSKITNKDIKAGKGLSINNNEITLNSDSTYFKINEDNKLSLNTNVIVLKSELDNKLDTKPGELIDTNIIFNNENEVLGHHNFIEGTNFGGLKVYKIKTINNQQINLSFTGDDIDYQSIASISVDVNDKFKLIYKNNNRFYVVDKEYTITEKSTSSHIIYNNDNPIIKDNNSSYYIYFPYKPYLGNIKLESLYSHIEGSYNIIHGTYSHVEGKWNAIYGDYSHGEGGGTVVCGDCSHAEGQNTVALGECTHSEGADTKAVGKYSHTEGFLSYSIGVASHAEGADTKAVGNYSHTEGLYTYSEGIASHSEGAYNKSIGEYSHSEGAYNNAIGDYSHVSGYNNISYAYEFVIGKPRHTASSLNIATTPCLVTCF